MRRRLVPAKPENCHYWITCRAFTVEVEVNKQDKIVNAAPIVQRFVGQSFGSLLMWAERLGGLKWERL